MKSTAEVVVIGGGIMGASTAYHLAKRGCTDVVVLESAEMFGLGSTGLNAGGVRYQFATEVNVELSKLAFGMMERFADEMDQEISLRRFGYLFMLDTEKDLEQFRKNVALQNRLGVPSQVIGVDDIARLAPEVQLDGIIGGTWCPLDGLVDPNSLLQGYVKQARRLGVTLYENAAVTGIDVVDGKITGVSTKDGRIATSKIVVAAGAWSGQIGDMMGVDIPIVPIKRQIAVVNDIPGLRADFPFVIDFSKSLYFHREGRGILTGKSNANQEPGFDLTVDEDWRLRHFEEAMERLPLLGDAEISAEWAGLYEVTPDDQPILGALPQLDGVYSCAGFSGHGLMHGPSAGMLLAEEILDGRAHTVNIDPLRYARFATGAEVGEYNVV
ncbi:MAG TPA: FAD-binding oxidoreductase [Gemmatimonadaceae bacterium]